MKRFLRIYAPEQAAQSKEKRPSLVGTARPVPQGVRDHDDPYQAD